MSFGERNRLDARIRRVFDQIAQLTSVKEDEICAELSRYAAVLTSGLLEAACRDIVGKFAEKRADPSVVEYVRRKLGGFQNPDMTRILELVGSFGLGRRKQFEAGISDDLKDAVDSVVNNKNLVAHGRDSGISSATVRDYFDRCNKVISLIENAFAA